MLAKNQIFFCLGQRLAQKFKPSLIAYKRNKEVKPIAAFKSVHFKYLRVLIITSYVAPLVENPSLLLPSKEGTWPAIMLIEEPVINAAMAGSGMKSTIQPTRIKPMKVTIAPVIIANEPAI